MKAWKHKQKERAEAAVKLKKGRKEANKKKESEQLALN